MATAELRLSLPVDSARDAVGSALAEQGFSVKPTASGSLDVSRGSLGTTLVAGAFAGQDMHVRFDVHFSPVEEGTLAAFEHSSVGGFFKGGAIGAAKVGDVVRQAAHLAGGRLAQQGVLAGGAQAIPDAPEGATEPVGDDAGAASVPPVPVAPGETPGSPATAAYPTSAGSPAPSSGDAGSYPGAAQAYGAPGETPGSPATAAYPTSAGSPAPSSGDAGSYPGAAQAYGAPAYGVPGAPYGAVPGASERTNGIAILAIILGFVFPIGGIIAGSVALAQVKRTGEKGRGLAITGIVAGSVIAVLAIIAVIGLLIFSFTVGSKASSSDPFGAPGFPQDGGVTVGPSEAAPGEGDVFTLPIGVCLDDVPGGFISPSNIADCAAPHTYEVFDSVELPAGAFPGDDAIASAAQQGCEAAFPAFVGIPSAQSALDYQYVAPTEDTWADGDREISCLVYDPAVEQTTGSLAGAAR